MYHPLFEALISAAGGRGGECEWQRAAGPAAFLSCLPAASPPGLFLRPRPASAGPARGPAFAAPAPRPEARRQKEEGEAAGLGQETLLRRQPRRDRFGPHPRWARGHRSSRRSPRGRREAARLRQAERVPLRRGVRGGGRCPLGIIRQGRAGLPPLRPLRHTHTIDPAFLPHIRGLYAQPAEAFRLLAASPLPAAGAHRARPAALFT